jgi:cytochrome c5
MGLTTMNRLLILTIITLLTVSCANAPQPADYSQDGRKVDIAWGKKIYGKNCAPCHDDGTDGAQIIGDVEGWRSRIARGIPSLVSNAITGYSGALGFMPPRGGNPTLSHEDVTAATFYIVQRSSK